MKKPTILIVNDDGFDAPGIKELYASVKDIGDVYVVAPSSQRSGASVGFTFGRPLTVEKAEGYDTHAWKVDGTPADCVKVALSILKIEPDLIVSGINHGSNAGTNLLYSGTVGGIIEGSHRGYTGIAFSFEHLDNQTFHDMKMFIPPIVEYVIDNSFATGVFFNVTFPHHPHTEIKGIRLARQGRSGVFEDPKEHAEGSYHLGGKWFEQEELPDSDIALLKEKYITVVPCDVRELTHHETLSSHASLLEEKLQKYELSFES